MRVGFKSEVIGWGYSWGAHRARSRCAWYPIGSGIASKTAAGTRLPRHFVRVPLSPENRVNAPGEPMTCRIEPSRIEPYRVQAYNTAKLSENKMHDDTVAKRFGFSGGLVPGVDVMAYMMHLPVKRWGRAFLEPGLIEALFVKPVYDGETTHVSGAESDGALTIEVESRGQLCA